MNSDAHMNALIEISSVSSPAALENPIAASPKALVRSLKSARREAIDRFEVEYVRALLQKSEGNVTRAAAMADVSRQVIHKLIAKHRLSSGASSAG